MLVNSKMFSPAVRFFNFTVERAKYKDYVGFWEALNETGKRPPYILIVPDGYAINRGSPGGIWFSTLQYFDRFIDRTVTVEPSLRAKRSNLSIGVLRRMTDCFVPRLRTRVVRAFSIKNRVGPACTDRLAMTAQQMWYAFNESMTWEMFRDSAKSLLHHKPVWDMGGIIKEAQAPGGVPLYLGDGAISDFPEPKSDALAKARFYGSLGAGVDSTSMVPWSLDPKAVQAFDLFLKDAHQKGTRVMIVIPPFHPLAFKTIANLRILSDPFNQYRATFKKLAAENPGTVFCDVMDPAPLGCTEDDFVDALHMEPRCGEKMIRSCFAGQAGWNELLPQVPPKAP